ncbi:helix-turn-helix domain-containing protein [Neorhodopirellula pilleata]|uniref:Chromosomal replication initiator protein DnaA n=1 Tax=Neorhodopirellula pilleata TaxID=2714738 RepID=A0A5C6AW51_9BACT|nr:helix-turn-helix domain-containing protein [Neorhodopirellula pilleata]TWU03737.1 Chromosomal replication initiator protein DnaA [Neorhodopirellula pilleata]
MVAPTPTTVSSFALERPSLRRRRRETPVVQPVTPLFYYGRENRLAGYVCDHSVEPLIEVARPLLLVGPSGVGKTTLALHIAQRIGINSIWDSINADAETASDGNPGVTSKVLSSRVLYQPAIDFAREFASSIDSKDMPRMRRRLDEAVVWVIDDLHAIADKAPAQEELAARLEARDAAGRITIVTCRRLPSEIRGLRSPLVSRTLPGLTVTLHPPEGETRHAILRELMMAHLPDSDPDSWRLLDGGLDAAVTVRELDAAVKQVAMWCRMNESPVCVEAIESAIGKVGAKEEISIKSITSAVARHLGVKSSDMRSGSRRQNIVRARSLAMYLSRQMTESSLTQIGDAFGGRDHSTVLHSIRKIESAFDEDATLRRTADQITERLTE